MKLTSILLVFIYVHGSYSLFYQETSNDDIMEFINVHEIPGDNARSKRSTDADFPASFNFLLEMAIGNVSLNLAQSVPSDNKIPIYSLIENGGIVKVKNAVQGDYGVYQDSYLGASIIVSRPDQDIDNMELFGSFTVNGNHYQIEPLSPSDRRRRSARLESGKDNSVNINHRIRRQSNPYGDFLGDELLPPPDSAGLNRPALMPPYPGDTITIGQDNVPIIQLQNDKPSAIQDQEETTNNTEDSTRHRRDTSQTLYIEYMAVIDYKNLERWKSMVDGNTDQEKQDNAFNVMGKYYQFIINGIDVRFRTATNDGQIIRVNLTNILVSTENSTSPWIKNNMLSENSIDDAGVLLDFATWRKSMIEFLPRHDHAGLFTGFDLATPTSLNPIGMGYLNSICHTSWAVSEIEETYNAVTVHIAAHELGHNIGTRHDGNGNSCQTSSLYLMAPRLPTIYDPSIRTNPWTFSTCSQNSIKTFIAGLGSDNCLMDTPKKRYLKNELAGQIYSVDEQCNMTFGNDAVLCRENIYDKLDSVCYAMQCRLKGSSSCQGRFFPFDGTPCGDKKWCFSGECINSELAPPADESCLYGDDPLKNCSTSDACDVNDFLSSKVRCCKTCSQLSTTSSSTPTSSISTLSTTTSSTSTTTSSSSTTPTTSTTTTSPSTTTSKQSTTTSPTTTTTTTSSSTITSTQSTTTSPTTTTTTTTSSSTTTTSPTSTTTTSPATTMSSSTTTTSPTTTTTSSTTSSSSSTTTTSPTTTSLQSSTSTTTSSPSTTTSSTSTATSPLTTTTSPSTTTSTTTKLSTTVMYSPTPLDKELTFDIQTMISLFVTTALVI